MPTILFLDGHKENAHYSTAHASSSYGQAVLVSDETGAAYGPGDLIGCQVIDEE